LTSKKSKGESSPFAAFLLGCVLIPFALVMLWKNEKKQVTYAKVIGLAKKECITIKIEEPFDEHEFYLVAGSGRAVNSESIDDHDFGATVQDSYRLIRTVEMYQWVRKERRVERNGERHTEVYYES